MTMAAIALCACAPRTHPSDTKTIHDAAASHVWITQDTGDVVMCDVAMLPQAGTRACARASRRARPAVAVLERDRMQHVAVGRVHRRRGAPVALAPARLFAGDHDPSTKWSSTQPADTDERVAILG